MVGITPEPIVTSPLPFSAAQLQGHIFKSLKGRKHLFSIDECDEDVTCEIEYEIGKLIEHHLEACVAEQQERCAKICEDLKRKLYREDEECFGLAQAAEQIRGDA